MSETTIFLRLLRQLGLLAINVCYSYSSTTDSSQCGTRGHPHPHYLDKKAKLGHGFNS